MPGVRLPVLAAQAAAAGAARVPRRPVRLLMPPHFHPNQVQCAESIVAEYQRGLSRSHYGVLYAECQSGKSGTFHKVAQLMLTGEEPQRIVDRVYILCGSSETRLRDQAKKDAMFFNPMHYAAGAIRVIFHSEFEKTHDINVHRALIIVDESHLDQNATQKFKEFAHRNGFEFTGEDFESMRETETYILSVSATPYSELSNIMHKKTPHKFVARLMPGDGYRGLDYYNTKEHIKTTFRIQENSRRFFDIVRAKGNKYNIVRAVGEKETSTTAALRAGARTEHVRLLEYSMRRQDIAITWDEWDTLVNDKMEAARKELRREGASEADIRAEQIRIYNTFPCLEEAPAEPTIVLIKGTLRCGKVVPKKHIGIVWEDSKNPATDVIVQGLLGRMCGYEFGDAMPDIYLSCVVTEHLTSHLRRTEFERAQMLPDLCIPRKGRNLRGTGEKVYHREDVPPVAGYFTSPPLLLRAGAELDEEFVEETRNYSAENATELSIGFNGLTLLQADDWKLLREHEGFTEEQRTDILEKVSEMAATGQRVPIRHLRTRPTPTGPAPSHPDYYKDLAVCLNMKTSPREHVLQSGTGVPSPISFVVLHEGYTTDSVYGLVAPAGSIIVVFSSEMKGTGWEKFQQVALRFPPTSGIEMFDPRYRRPEAPPAAAVAALQCFLNAAALTEPDVFYEQMADWLRFYCEQKAKGERGLIVANKTTARCRGRASLFTFSNDAFHVVSKTDNDLVRICTELSEQFGLTVRADIAAIDGVKTVVRAITWN